MTRTGFRTENLLATTCVLALPACAGKTRMGIGRDAPFCENLCRASQARYHLHLPSFAIYFPLFIPS